MADSINLNGKVALVTGAAGGIGSAICRKLSSRGASIALVDYADPSALAEQLSSSGESCRAYKMDLSDLGQCKAVVENTANDFSKLDILVNCAGVFRGKSLADSELSDWDYHMNIIARAPYFLMKHAVPHMQKQGGGRIVNITSICAVMGFPGTAIYTAAKGALESATRVLMCDLARSNINVNAVAPGNIETTINEHLREVPGYVEKWNELTPHGIAFLPPTSIANAVAFLVSDDAAHVHGQELLIDGGVSAGISTAAVSLEG